MVRCTWYNSNVIVCQLYLIQHYVIVCQWLVAGLWFSPGAPVSPTNKTDCHNITEILLNSIAPLSPLKLWVWILLMERCTWYNIMWSSLSVTCVRSVVFFKFLREFEMTIKRFVCATPTFWTSIPQNFAYLIITKWRLTYFYWTIFENVFALFYLVCTHKYFYVLNGHYKNVQGIFHKRRRVDYFLCKKLPQLNCLFSSIFM